MTLVCLMLKKSYLYLIAGLIVFIGTGVWHSLSTDYYTSKEYFISQIESKIEQELIQLELEMIPILDTVSTTDLLKFEDFKAETKYPYFIYRNSELKIWSNYHYVPAFEQVDKDRSLSIVNSNGSIYLMRTWVTESRAGRFEIAGIIPLYIDYKVQNSYLTDFTNIEIFKRNNANISLLEKDSYLPIQIREESLLWISDDFSLQLENSNFNKALFSLYSLGLLFCLIGLALWTIQLSKKKGKKWILLVGIIVVWGLLKLIMALFGFPDRFIQVDMFDPRFFAVSWFERSFGDMLLNTVAIFLLSIVLFRNFRQVIRIYKPGKITAILLNAFWVILLHLIINYQYLQLRTIYFNSQLSLDITQSFSFNNFRIYSLLVFLLIGVSSALLFHVVFKRLEAYATDIKQRTLAILIGTVIFVAFSFYVNLPLANLVLVAIAMSILFFSTGIHRSLQQANISLTLYVLFWIIVESLIGGWCVHDFEKTKESNSMVRYAQNLALKNDYMAEFMLNEVMESVSNDPSISARLSNPFLSKEYIVNKILKGYFSNYLDKYASSIYLYTQSGEGLPEYGTTQNYHTIKQRYALDENSTEYDELFILTQDIRSLSKHYMAFLPIMRYDNIIGYIIIDCRQRRLVPENVYPELLIDNRFSEYQNSNYSYAIFEQDFLIHSSGDMDYNFLNIEALRDMTFWSQNGYLHYLLADGDGDTVIVSKPYDPLWQIISNTSFLIAAFLLPTIILLLTFLLYSLQKGREISYTAKIQVFLYLAFFVPLVLVTVTTLSFITTSFREELMETKISDSSRLASQIETETDAFLVDVTSKDLLTEKLEQLARYGNFDATVFGIDGEMITATQPGIYSNGLQSGLLNSHAFLRLIEGDETNIIIDESIGRLNYYTTYSAIKSRETNRLLGVLGIPFFKAESTIETNQIEALNTILNVFVVIFLIALISTFQTSRWLTAPLLIIRERIGKTSFSGENVPINWDSDDEIGKLITEYNNMLVKLENSKEALARSQKESAWREVAQQVAHEIKNPLTPMKLTLQKLERAIGDGGSNDKIEVTVKNLLSQLQILNDIVTSFSEFAKMPIPKNEKMNLSDTIHELKVFFDNEEKIDLELQLHSSEVLISADKKLMNRILSNIIINAGQSRKEGQKKVKVVISTVRQEENKAILLTLSDNGTGISDDVVERVFIPRFSTKKEGSGIGLAVAKHGVENSGGAIWFETEWDKGTRFYIQLPELEQG